MPSTSGRVTAVEMRLMPHSSGLSALCVVIAPDGEEAWCERQPVAWRSLTPDEVRDQVRDQGVVGLGGAVFPTHLKLKPGRQTAVKTVVLNGAECEPFITCDDLLMRERAAGIIEGARILRHMLQAEEVLIGIEDNKPEAVAALQAAIARLGDDRQRHQDPPPPNLPLTGEEIIGSRRSIKNDHSGSESIKVVAVPTRYPGRRCKTADPRADGHRGAAWRAFHRLRGAVLQRGYRLCAARGAEPGPANGLAHRHGRGAMLNGRATMRCCSARR
jgi:hypothetical protein